MQLPPQSLPRRARLLPLLHAEHERSGWLTPASVAAIALEARMPVAEAWEAATSYRDFRFESPSGGSPACTGLSCQLAGATVEVGAIGAGCRFRCYEAPVRGHDEPLPEPFIRDAGPLLAPDTDGWFGLDRVRSLGHDAALAEIDASGLRGRGGAYFPLARKWAAALEQRRPIALVVNAEEGEPGVFKDRALLCRRPRRFLEGLAIAVEMLRPAVVAIVVNGEAEAARASLEAVLTNPGLPQGIDPWVVPGGGGYILGEETTLLNALEGRKPVPRLRPPYPVESGLFGMPTVINNVETLTNLSVIFREGAAGFRKFGTAEAPGTKLFSVSGRVREPGVYELPLGVTLAEVLDRAGGANEGSVTAVLTGGPSGGFLAPPAFGVALAPGSLHPTGAMVGAGGLVVLDESSDIRAAVLATAQFNAEESCGKCTPCREGSPRMLDLLRENDLAQLEPLLEVVGAASLCGLGQMAPNPVRSALHFWPELFR
jgi:NADH:ubiquinone oxidoreductase subunit F (NADH-binding)